MCELKQYNSRELSLRASNRLKAAPAPSEKRNIKAKNVLITTAVSFTAMLTHYKDKLAQI